MYKFNLLKLVLLMYNLICSNADPLKSMTKKIYIGSALGSALESSDTNYKTIAAQEFNCVTPENAMKWDSIEKVKGKSDYSSGDKLVTFAQTNQMKVRGHTLVWHESLPSWVQQLANNKAELEKAMNKHITEVVTHYKGKIYAWDVLNELLNEDGTFRDTIWHKNFGQSFIAEALRTAHTADPNAKLYINDYNVEGKNPKSDGLYNLVKSLKAQGVPIHGVGLQSHLTVGQMPTNLKENMQRFSDLGLDVAITELDLWIKLPSSAKSLQLQADEYAQMYSTCLSVSRCVGVTVWGFTDKYLWIGDYRKGYGEADLWDKNLKPKPAVAAVQKVLK